VYQSRSLPAEDKNEAVAWCCILVRDEREISRLEFEDLAPEERFYIPVVVRLNTVKEWHLGLNMRVFCLVIVLDVASNQISRSRLTLCGQI
jgi:hypothetical protein